VFDTEGVIPLHRALFHMHSDDPDFLVRRSGTSSFLLSGEVSSQRGADLDVGTPSGDFDVSLASHCRPEHAVKLLRRELPREVVMVAREGDDGITVTLTEALVPAARPPRLRIISSDLVQRVHQLEENKVEFEGALGSDCHVTVLCDGRRVTLQLPRGLSADGTALRLAANMPHGFRALADGATLSVWRDADFFEQVA
jgi:hypothetical protein